MGTLFRLLFLVLGWGLLIGGLLVIVLAFPATDAHRKKQAEVAEILMKAGMRRSDIPGIDVGPAPMLALGGIMAGLGVHLLAIRPRAVSHHPCAVCAENIPEGEAVCHHCGAWVTSDS